MVLPTWLLFGPIAGFHHHVAFGIFFYMVWNGEDPAPGSFQLIEGYEVHVDPIRLAVSCLAWLMVLASVIILVTAIRRLGKAWRNISAR
jgi:hypothetical protein